jgi:hypothetical protein
MRSGATGFVLKDDPADDIVRAVRVVAAGDAMIAPATTRRTTRVAARPSRRGIRMSIGTTSGRFRRISRNAASPSPAWPTTSRSGSPCRTSGLPLAVPLLLLGGLVLAVLDAGRWPLAAGFALTASGMAVVAVRTWPRTVAAQPEIQVPAWPRTPAARLHHVRPGLC